MWSFPQVAAAVSAKDQVRVAALQDSIKKLRDKLADQQRMMKLAEAQVDKVKRLENEIVKIKEAKVRAAMNQRSASRRCALQ